MFGTGKKLLQHVLPGVVKPMRVLWNEIIGFIFLCIAILAFPSVYRNVRDFDGEPRSLFRIGLSGAFALIMLGFGIGSFIRAKKIARQ